MQVHFPSFGGLKAFYAVVETGRLKSAAELLGISPSGVSHQIKRLEQELNVPLLTSTEGRLQPTAQGLQYFQSIRPAMRTILEATDTLVSHGGRQRLTLAFGPSFAASWLLPRMKAFQEAHPDIELNLIANPRLNDLTRERIALAVRRGAGNWPGLTAELLLPEQLFPVMAPAYHSRFEGRAMAEVLAEARLISNTTVPDEWGEWCRAHALGEPPAGNIFGLDGFELTMQAARDGLGIALGRKPLVDGLLASKALVAPFGTVTDTDMGYYIAWRSDADLTVAMRRTIDWFRAQAGQDDKMSIETDKMSIET